MNEVVMPNANQDISKMPGHWVLATLGKKVLRPGGRELTIKMLEGLDIQTTDRVVELAPGLGFTTRLCLARQPMSYTAVERDEQAANTVRSYLTEPDQVCLLGSAEQTGLDMDMATVIYGEAMLTMQSTTKKQQIVAEAARVLQPNGRYAIHELCILPDDIDPEHKREIQKDLAQVIKVSAKPITAIEWRQVLQDQGFVIRQQEQNAMALLEPKRMVQDEGWWRAFGIFVRLLFRPAARRRVLAMRRVFIKHRANLGAIVLVGELTDSKSQ